MVRKRKVMHAPKFLLLLIVIMKRGRDIASFFAPVNKKGRETNQSIERVEEQEEGEPEESVELERGHVMKVRALTQRGKFQRVRSMKKRVRRKKTYRDRERNSQRDRKWIHVDQVLHHQVCDEEGSYYLQSSAIII